MVSRRNDVYNPATRPWRTAHPIGEGFYGFTLVKAPDGFLYALGGSHDGNNGWYGAVSLRSAVDAWSYQALRCRDQRLLQSRLVERRVCRRPSVHYRRRGHTGRLFPADYTLRNMYESLRMADSLCESSVQATPAAVAPGDHITYTIELHGEVNAAAQCDFARSDSGRHDVRWLHRRSVGRTVQSQREDQVEWLGPLARIPRRSRSRSGSRSTTPVGSTATSSPTL